MNKFFTHIKEALKEAISYKKGKITLRSEIIEIPKPQKDYSAKKTSHEPL